MSIEQPGGRTDLAKRLVAVPPERIFAVFDNPAALMQWLPPKGMTGHAHEYDFRQGGTYRIELEYLDGNHGPGKTTAKSDISKGRFVEIVPDRIIRQTVEFEGDDSIKMTMTWTFDPVPEGTSVTVTAEDVPSGISAEDHQKGLSSSLENLAEFVGG
ncbi:MAG TPA: SRPBCC domain-containing protein [Vineibacter sp.]|nr:SRPBCC domain-containing protein [Vineibacter sp.]